MKLPRMIIQQMYVNNASYVCLAVAATRMGLITFFQYSFQVLISYNFYKSNWHSMEPTRNIRFSITFFFYYFNFSKQWILYVFSPKVISRTTTDAHLFCFILKSIINVNLFLRHIFYYGVSDVESNMPGKNTIAYKWKRLFFVRIQTDDRYKTWVILICVT